MKVGFIGLGTMGAPMALNLVKAGFELKVFDIEPYSDRVQRVVKQGAKLCNNPSDVSVGAEFVLLSLPTQTVSEEVTLGKEGIVQTAAPGSVIIELSTVSPATIKKYDAAAKSRGIEVLDAPVSGGRTGAEAATLTIMVGGRRETFDRCRPILESIGKKVCYVGEIGSGEIVKLLNNMLVLTDLITARSILEITVKAGIDPKLVHDIINASTGQSWVWTNWIPTILTRKTVGSTPDIFKKDVTIALEMAENLKLYPETATAALNFLRTYTKNQQGTRDISTIFEFLS
ncbi:NAD(P)-dependent oxidoreductase [[Eubacterium] cellulosolvens]